ncbi:MAG TPA: AIR synthase related protein [Atribacteraceae bacterium]|nr:AIR synthase related protein [Atribacteraceae bacterium]
MVERDGILIERSGGDILVVACDSAGGIGGSPGDTIKAPPSLVGSLTARVALAEVLSLGARPLACSVTACFAPGPDLEEMIRGVRRELHTIALDQLPMVVSSEKNIPVGQTGVGITVVGSFAESGHAFRRSEGGEILCALGRPSVGEEVLNRQDEIADLFDLVQIHSLDYTGEIVPVGSGGVFQEALGIARRSRLKIRFQERPRYSLYQSAGPATVVLFSSAEPIERLQALLRKPLWRVGLLEDYEGGTRTAEA